MHAFRPVDELNSPLVPFRGESNPPPPRRVLPFSPALAELDNHLSEELDGACWAVVDFVPEDAAWCDWLYRNLNGYPVPSPLIERMTPHGFPRPDCLSIFPDRRDPEHEEHLPSALALSKYLIVVCSPHSAHAAACDEEIRAFKSTGGEERIIVLVVEGQPDAGSDRLPLPPTAEWLPVWLRWRMGEDGVFINAERSEPRIIDARPGAHHLQEVRDELLAALLETRSDQLAALGGLTRPVEFCPPPPVPPVAAQPAARIAEIPAAPRRKREPVLVAALLCAVVAALATVWWPKHLFTVEAPGIPAAAAVAAVPAPAQQITVPAEEPVAAVPAQAPPEAPVALVVPEAPAPELPEPPPELTLREVAKSLHNRGDRAFTERRPEQALEYYAAALETARSHAAQPGVDATARGEVALLARKLGTLQARYASTAEARASFDLGRKTLLRLKARGVWKGEHQRLLQELEAGLRALPRDWEK